MKPTIQILLIIILYCLSLSQLINAQQKAYPPIAKDALIKPIREQNIQLNENLNMANVKITMTHFTPYCGGAAPSQEILDRRTHLMPNQIFNLVNVETQTKTQVKTDSLGVLNLTLDPGSYAIQELYKDCTFSEFMQKANQQTGMYIQDMGDDCYEIWWKSYMGEFIVTSDTTTLDLHMGESSSCFTGNNPCLIYTGPYPP